MASTTFVDGTTPVVAAWLNDVNKAVYTGVFPALTTFTLGGLSYSDAGAGFSYGISTNGYAQDIVQNTSSGTAASADYIVSNNLGTASTYYGDFGINSSGFSGTGSLSLPNATYLYSQNGDLVLGTQSSNAIHFVINNGATDAGTVSTAGNWTINSPSSGSVLTAAQTNDATQFLAKFTGKSSAPGLSTSVQISGYQAALSVINAASNQNWYFGLDDANSNRLNIGTGYGAAQGLTPMLTIATAGNVAINAPSSGTALTVNTYSGSGIGMVISGATATDGMVRLDGAAGTARGLMGTTAGVYRWQVRLGTSAAESGSNAGSDFSIDRYSDAGGFLSTPLTISRSTGAITVAAPSTATTSLSVNQYSSGAFEYGIQLTGSDSNGTNFNVANSGSGNAGLWLGVAAGKNSVIEQTSTSLAIFTSDATSNLTLGINNTTKLTISNTGVVTIATPNSTGYGTPTGGAKQASFVAGSITLPNLAAAVAQLIIDLKTFGVLGA